MKRIVCFHSDVDFGVTTHLRELRGAAHVLKRVRVRVRVRIRVRVEEKGREGNGNGAKRGVRWEGVRESARARESESMRAREKLANAQH